MNKPGRLVRYLKTLNVYLASCLAGILMADCACANPQYDIIDVPPKPHCKVMNPGNALYNNVMGTVQYIKAGDIDTVRQVLRNKLPVNVFVEQTFTTDNSGKVYRVHLSLLDHAVVYQQHEIVDLLLEYGANPEGCGREMFDPMNIAIANGDYRILDKLVQAGANPNTLVGPAELQENALHVMLDKKDICDDGLPHHDMLGSMQLLLSRGANINARNHLGETPLYKSIRHCPENSFYPLTSLLLITHGADPFIATHDGRNIFHQMHQYTNLSRNNSLWRLLAHYVYAGGNSMLTVAKEYREMANELKAIQTELTAPRGRLGWLWASASMGDPLYYYLPGVMAVFQYRPAFRHDPEKTLALVSCPRDASCDTPLHHAGRRHLTPPSLRWMTWLGANINSASSVDGNTLLHFVLKNNQLNFLDKLLVAGADPFIRNAEDMTSFDIAMVSLPSESRRKALDQLCSSEAIPEHNRANCQNYFHHMLNECDHALAVENITLPVTSQFEESLLSSHIISGCLAHSQRHLTSHMFVQQEPLDKFLERKPGLATSATAQCHYDGCDNEVPVSGKMALLQLQSFGQVKQFLGNPERSDTAYLLTSLVYSSQPEMLAYALNNGARYQSTSAECPFSNDPYLCLNPARAALKPGIHEDMNPLLKLFGSYYYGMDRQDRQNQLDLSLMIAIQRQDPDLMKQYLFLGANPNTYITEARQAAIARAQSTPEKPAKLRLPTCGVFADALRLEQDLEVAPMSRALLLYGASVKPFQERQCSYTAAGNNILASPLFWSRHIKDKALARAIQAYDPEWNLYPSEGSTGQKVFGGFQEVTSQLLQETALAQHGVYLEDGALSPQCACLSLSAPDNPNFTPYCQSLTSTLSASTRISLCRPELFH